MAELAASKKARWGFGGVILYSSPSPSSPFPSNLTFSYPFYPFLGDPPSPQEDKGRRGLWKVKTKNAGKREDFGSEIVGSKNGGEKKEKKRDQKVGKSDTSNQSTRCSG